MALIGQKIANKYAAYNGDCCEVIADLPAGSVDLSVYSPPFCGLYNYSSDERDMSNSRTYEDFFDHYGFLVNQMARVTKPGRMSCVHAMDIPNAGQRDGYFDLPGRIIQMHNDAGFMFFGRVTIWKEPLRVAVRTRLKHLTHKQLVKDSTASTIAAGDTLLLFKRRGENATPVTHEGGFQSYAGERTVPEHLWQYKGTADQRENKLSHWIWRQYASCVWDDIRINRVLPFRDAKEADDEKHVHPLQLDVIDRCVRLWSNPNEVVFTPFMGVGSEAYGALTNGRRAIGVELKTSYYKQALRNLIAAETGEVSDSDLFSLSAEGAPAEDEMAGQ